MLLSDSQLAQPPPLAVAGWTFIFLHQEPLSSGKMKVVGIAIISAYLCGLIGTEGASYNSDSWLVGDLHTLFTSEFTTRLHGSSTYDRDENPSFEYHLGRSTFGVERTSAGKMRMTNSGPATLRFVLQDAQVDNKSWLVGIIDPHEEHFVEKDKVHVWIAQYPGPTGSIIV